MTYQVPHRVADPNRSGKKWCDGIARARGQRHGNARDDAEQQERDGRESAWPVHARSISQRGRMSAARNARNSAV